MKRTVRIVKRLFLVVIVLVGLLALAVFIFVNTSPQFGQPPEGADLERIRQSPHYNSDGFVNLIETSLGPFSEMMKSIPEMLFGPAGEPDSALPVRFGESPSSAIDSLCYITWYGHSAFLIEMDGQRILIDPMLGETPAPLPFGSDRFKYERPIPIEELTNIDIVILSHDHYDHLDYPTILAIKEEVEHFYTALGVGSHLKSWGVPAEQITELDWWQSADADGIALVACPSRHFSGRGLTDRWKTQWASWVVKGAYQNLYFSGDGGYGPHFAEIGEQHGPFDLAMMECGQYFHAWKQIHMMPEESVRAGLELGGELLMPIHWGAFKLAPHDWKDPILRFTAEAERLQVPVVHPYIGERFCLGLDFPRSAWWSEVY